MAEEFENFTGTFLLCTKVKGKYALKLLLLCFVVAITAAECFLINYVQELGRKYVVSNKTWNNRAMKVDEKLRWVLELVFVCRCFEGIQVYIKIFFKMPSLLTSSMILPRICSTVWLMMAGVMYLVAASFDNVESIIMDCLTFEIIFDVEGALHRWTVGDTHEALVDMTKEDDDDNDSGAAIDVSLLGPLLRSALAISITIILDCGALGVMNGREDRLIDLFIRWASEVSAMDDKWGTLVDLLGCRASEFKRATKLDL